MSAGALRTQLLFDEARCFLATAKTVDQTLVGHAFAVRFPYPPLGGGEVVCWVTQLVVDAAFRSRGVATGLCRALLKLPDPFDQPFFACGIASSHPHAVRALERAAGRPRCPETAREHGAGLLAASGVPYLRGCVPLPIPKDPLTHSVDTRFFVDHTEVDAIVESGEDPMAFPRLAEGHEYLAIIKINTE